MTQLIRVVVVDEAGTAATSEVSHDRRQRGANAPKALLRVEELADAMTALLEVEPDLGLVDGMRRREAGFSGHHLGRSVRGFDHRAKKRSDRVTEDSTRRTTVDRYDDLDVTRTAGGAKGREERGRDRSSQTKPPKAYFSPRSSLGRTSFGL